MVYNQQAAESSLEGAVKYTYEGHKNSEMGSFALVPNDLSPSSDLKAMMRQAGGRDGIPEIPYSAGDSRARTWEVGIDEWINRAEIADPIVFVMPDDDLSILNRSLVGAVAQNDVTLTDYSDFQDLQSDPSVGSFIRSVSFMGSVWTQHHQAMGRTVWVYLGGVLAALLLNLVTVLAVWYAVFKIFHQRLRANYVYGQNGTTERE